MTSKLEGAIVVTFFILLVGGLMLGLGPPLMREQVGKHRILFGVLLFIYVACEVIVLVSLLFGRKR
jgi:hypothetical protein